MQRAKHSRGFVPVNIEMKGAKKVLAKDFEGSNLPGYAILIRKEQKKTFQEC